VWMSDISSECPVHTDAILIVFDQSTNKAEILTQSITNSISRSQFDGINQKAA
jgi:hypothetical protein